LAYVGQALRREIPKNQYMSAWLQDQPVEPDYRDSDLLQWESPDQDGPVGNWAEIWLVGRSSQGGRAR